MRKQFSILHQNIRSLRVNFDTFSAYIATLNPQPDLIFVSEIWIYSHESDEFHLPNYNFIACCNDTYRSGGVGVLINRNYPNFSIQQYNWTSADLLIVNIQFDSQAWTFVCIYRFHNKDISTFCNDLEILLRSLNNCNIVILGDINVNILNYSEAFNYLSMLASNGFLSLLNEPTRDLACLDHLFAKTDAPYEFIVDNLPLYFSDHNLISMRILFPDICQMQTAPTPTFTKINYDKLRNYLQIENWETVFSVSDCNVAFCSFIKILKSHVDSSKEKIVIGQKKALKPWMNSNLLRKISKLKKFSKKLRRYPENVRLKRYTIDLSRSVSLQVKSVKCNYYRSKFEQIGTDSKTAWKIIDDVLGRNHHRNQITQIYKHQTDTLLSCPMDISNEFNTFFTNISSSSNYSNSVLDDSNRFIVGTPKNFSSSCFFEPISGLEIAYAIKNLQSKSSKGYDEVDNFIIKNCSWFLVDVLKYLFNLSLESGVFPDVLKIAVVLPVHKKGDVLKLNNYRPISLLSSFSKIFEKLIKRRVVCYLDHIKFLNDNQFGFRDGKSTEDALLNFLSRIYLSLNKSLKPLALFVDISKAFDTVDHNILLTKLYTIGFRGKVLGWFGSYLRNRRQVVKINAAVSDTGNLSCGVPQGSVLGPLLFLIYFNSIFEINLLGHATAFADDLALIYSQTNQNYNVQQSLNEDLTELAKWFYYNKLTISNKSKILHFGSLTTTVASDSIMYHVYWCDKKNCASHCFELEAVKEFKYLGIVIDSQLNWKSHLDNRRKHVITAVYKFYNIRKFCPTPMLRKLYHALVESIIMYGISAWGGTYFSNIEDLYIAQKRIVKLIYNCPRSTATVPLFRKLNILPLRYLYVYKVLKLFFVRSTSHHNRITYTYNLRNPNRFGIILCNSEKCRRFYLYMAPFWFNMIPEHLKELPTDRRHVFEKGIRNWLLNIDDIERYF